MKKCLFVILLSATIYTTSYGQVDTVDYYSLSLEQLMNIEIVSASKKSESLFDSPLSASVISREEIQKSGATSIMEALRLVPGVIVREQTNGNYDIHVRGLDNIPPNSLILSATNTTTLVMINNRPVYNYLQGGTFWESLPIDLIDVEKIEVIRGPSSTLYGPNAVSGVINILTTQLNKDGLSVNGNATYGSLQTMISNASIGYKFNKKLNIGFSGNYQSRGRDERYLIIPTNQWVDSREQLPIQNVTDRYPNPDKSMIKYGVNTFMEYNPSSSVRLNLSAGLQDSEVQNIMFDNFVTNLSTVVTESKYVDLKAETQGLQTQISYSTATQSPVKAFTGSTYDYDVVDASMEYELSVQSLSVKPGITFRSATYDDTKYWNTAALEGTLNGRKTIETYGGTLRLEYATLADRLRFTGGVRADRFTYPDDVFFSYQAAANYKINPKNLVRLVYSKAYRSPFIYDTHLNYSILSASPIPNTYLQVRPVGNKDLEMLNSVMLELGYRAQILKNLSMDVEVYSTTTENYTALIQGETVMTPQNYPIIATTTFNTENLPLTVKQLGTTISFNAVLGSLQIKPFITIQNTTLKDYSPYFNSTSAVPSPNNENDPATHNVNSGLGTEIDHKFTPKAFGGTYINYKLTEKFNVNVTSYWFSKQVYYLRDNITYQDGVRGVENIQGKLILNASLSYTPVKELTVFINAKNLLNDKSNEYFRSDVTQMMLLGGVSFSL